ncbi:DUF2946 family protein [Azospirillum rugosum]|uniref:DUF2946 domain-containing protein n=1 Tax=Azospirillum rugosum TaxID=416170 RepID=A0ABS4SVA7_9PROT|nr:DUF2946 family protein [Azospirillum rugosum]MBP2295897.1 hypothetical protein [Azospirillum rugosum]MDQ0530154.1 hypothetical protein [Azospirillum rugosum]
MTAWCAVLTLFVHAIVMGTHVPPPLAAALSQAAVVVVADEPCHDHGMDESEAPMAAHGDHGGPGKGPVGMPGHFTYCPICLSLHGGKLLGPAAAPVPVPPVAVVVATPLPADEVVHDGQPARPYAARAPPVVV